MHLEWSARPLSNAAMPLSLAHITSVELGPLLTIFLAGLAAGALLGWRYARQRQVAAEASDSRSAR
jgi:hypothetical protein